MTDGVMHGIEISRFFFLLHIGMALGAGRSKHMAVWSQQIVLRISRYLIRSGLEYNTRYIRDGIPDKNFMSCTITIRTGIRHSL